MPAHQIFASVDVHVSAAQAFFEFMSFEWLHSNAVLFAVEPRRFAVNDEIVLSFRGAAAAAHATVRVTRLVQDQTLCLEFVTSVDKLRTAVLQFAFETFGVNAAKVCVVKMLGGLLYNGFDEFAVEEARLVQLANGFRDFLHSKYPRPQVNGGFAMGSLDALSVNVAPPRWRYGAKNCHQCKTLIADAASALMDRLAARTHCRSCGREFCKSCCSKTTVVPTFCSAEPQRVCLLCFKDLAAEAETRDGSQAEIEALRAQVEAQVIAEQQQATATVHHDDDDDDNDRDDKRNES